MSISGLFCVALAYCIGSIPFGLLLSRTSGIDIRTQGSGNIGATNVTRLLGKKLGLLTLVLDMLKGCGPMLLGSVLLTADPQRSLYMALSGAAAVLGHMFPLYLRFKGGKGVATALGVFLYLSPWAVLWSLAVFLIMVRWSGFVSLGSLAASAAMPLWMALLGTEGWKWRLAAFVALLIWIKHAENIQRIRAGTEKKWSSRNPQGAGM